MASMSWATTVRRCSKRSRDTLVVLCVISELSLVSLAVFYVGIGYDRFGLVFQPVSVRCPAS